MSKAPGAGPSEQPPPAKPAHEAEEAPTAARGAVAGSVGALVSVAVLKTQLTANIFHNGSGPATPTAFSLLSTVVTTLILIPVFCGWRSQWTMLSWRMLWPDVAIIVAFTAADLGFTNIALSQLSVAVQQCIASTNPALTVLIESVYQRRLQHWVIYVVLLLLVTGAVLATKFSAATEVTGWGVLTACIAVSCSASKYVFAHGIMKKYKGALGSLALLFWLDVLMVPIYLVWTSANGELVAFFSQQLDALGWTSLLVTSALGGVRALTQFVVLQFLTATSMSAANIFTQVLNIAIGVTVQHTTVSGALVAGIVLTILSSAAYTLLKMNKRLLDAFDEAVAGWPPLGKRPGPKTGDGTDERTPLMAKEA